MQDFDPEVQRAVHRIQSGEVTNARRSRILTLAIGRLTRAGYLYIGKITPDAIVVTPRGRLLVRSICMVFDRYLREKRERAIYSKFV